MKKILIIDDDAFFRAHLLTTLGNDGYSVVSANCGEDGLVMVNQEKPDLVLLDGVMPDMDGFEVCKILRSMESNNLMPIIMLTSKDSQEDRLKGLELGADDYILKPFHEKELLSRIRNTLRRIDRNRSANPLTGLCGNLDIQREINCRIANCVPYAVVYVDLDNFKSFNDVYGFAHGDLAIKLTADILTEQTRLFGNPGDFIGHIGGDDFVLITTPDKAEVICREVISLFDTRIRQLYRPEDLKNGCIFCANRKGDIETFPITTITMAVVTNCRRTFSSHLDIAAVASELLHKLKQTPGSAFLFDRRRHRA